jgi:hypothetical protein
MIDDQVVIKSEEERAAEASATETAIAAASPAD